MPIYVVGHKNPDTDSICSAIGAAHLMQYRGEDAVAARAGEINKETAYALEKFGVEVPELISNPEKIVMVDHNEMAQGVEGIENAKIIAVLDHHRLGGLQTADPISVRIKPIGCTSTLVANMHWHRGIEIPKKIAGLLLSAIISDTLLFKSPTCTKIDKDAAEQLADIAGVDMMEYGMELLKAGAGVGDMTPTQIAKTDSKPFSFGATTAIVSQISVMDPQEVLSIKADMLSAMDSLRKEAGKDLYLTMITDILNESTTLLVAGEPKELVEKAFGKAIVDSAVELPGVVSRKKQVVPPMTDAAK